MDRPTKLTHKNIIKPVYAADSYQYAHVLSAVRPVVSWVEELDILPACVLVVVACRPM